MLFFPPRVAHSTGTLQDCTQMAFSGTDMATKPREKSRYLAWRYLIWTGFLAQFPRVSSLFCTDKPARMEGVFLKLYKLMFFSQRQVDVIILVKVQCLCSCRGCAIWHSDAKETDFSHVGHERSDLQFYFILSIYSH